jgi:hypothetical protein
MSIEIINQNDILLKFLVSENDQINIGVTEIERLLNTVLDDTYYHWRLIPVIVEKLNACNIYGNLGIETKEKLNKIVKKAILYNLATTAQIDDINLKLARNNIPILLLKGAAYNCNYYKKKYPRGSRDLDILVEKKNFEKAISILTIYMDLIKSENPGPLDGLYEVSLKSKNNTGIFVDFHYSITYPNVFNIDEKKLWENTIPHPYYKNENIRILNFEQSIIHQAIHCFRDLEFNRYSLVDLDRIMTNNEVDYGRLLDLANNVGCSKVLKLMLNIYLNKKSLGLTDDRIRINQSYIFIHSKLEKYKKIKVIKFLLYFILHDKPSKIISLVRLFIQKKYFNIDETQ